MPAIPYACYGTDIGLAKKIRDRMLPDYELVHGSFTLDNAIKELPDAFAGNLDAADAAAEPIGKNATVPKDQRQKPRFLVIGGMIPDDHWDTVKNAIESKAPGTTMIAVRKQLMMEEGITPATPEDEKVDKICNILRRKVVEKGVSN